jgi:hypothetical protein
VVDDRSTTINFEVPASMVTNPFEFRVELIRPSAEVASPNPSARYPQDGEFDSVAAIDVGELDVLIVPVRYDADGSGRLPNLSAQQLEALEDRVMGMFPVEAVNLTVRDPFPWGNAVASRTSWETLLYALQALRASDGAPDHIYYYGVVAPVADPNTYCGTCPGGIGFLASANSAASRVAVGLGNFGTFTAEAFAHELGHNHGRPHVPCGAVEGGDVDYPHAGGFIGAWGWDLVNDYFYAPAFFADFMGYCDPAWISDYSFNAIAERRNLIKLTQPDIFASALNLTYERVAVSGDGAARWLDPITLAKPPVGEPIDVSVDTDQGQQTVIGQLLRLDHTSGALLIVPPAKAARTPGQPLRATIDGQLVSL